LPRLHRRAPARRHDGASSWWDSVHFPWAAPQRAHERREDGDRAHLAEVTGMVLVPHDAVVVLATSVTATSRVLTVLPDAAMAGRHVPALLAVLVLLRLPPRTNPSAPGSTSPSAKSAYPTYGARQPSVPHRSTPRVDRAPDHSEARSRGARTPHGKCARGISGTAHCSTPRRTDHCPHTQQKPCSRKTHSGCGAKTAASVSAADRVCDYPPCWVAVTHSVAPLAQRGRRLSPIPFWVCTIRSAARARRSRTRAVAQPTRTSRPVPPPPAPATQSAANTARKPVWRRVSAFCCACPQRPREAHTALGA
jgi:hypothetical protein